MLGNAPLWDVAQTCHAALQAAEVPYAVLGGVAVCLHGYQRNTVDLDLLVRREDQAAIKTVFSEAGLTWDESAAEFRSEAGIQVQLLLAGDKAGRGAEVRLPDPSMTSTVQAVEGLCVLTLARLIETKLACGSGSVRRSHKDFADVVELIAVHRLGRAFARHLHASLRDTFRRLVGVARSE